MEPWTCPEGFAAVPALKDISNKHPVRSSQDPAVKKRMEDYVKNMETWLGGGIGRAQGAYDEMVFRTMVQDEKRFYDALGLVSEGARIDFQVGVKPCVERVGDQQPPTISVDGLDAEMVECTEKSASAITTQIRIRRQAVAENPDG